MAVKFGKDGTLYCNSIRCHFKNARNMIADGTYGNITSNVWTFNGAEAVTSPAGYKTYRSFHVNVSGENSMSQTLPNIDMSHKYYLGVMARSLATANTAIRVQIGGTNFINLYIGDNTNGNWVKYSKIAGGSSGSGVGHLNVATYGNEIWLSKFIMIDLTDTFGSGNEPSKEWCDNNIREWETIINYGCVSSKVPYDNLDYYMGSQLTKKYNFNYLQLDSNWEPREYMFGLEGNANYNEGFLTTTNSLALENTSKYYFLTEAMGYTQGGSMECYFPISEPPLDSVPIVIHENYCGGGPMNGWKRAGFFGGRESFSSGNYPLRFDFNNNKNTTWLRITALQLIKLSSVITQYNKYNGTSITIDDINKEWCDRWIDGRSSPIIHIKDPNKTNIQFEAFKQVNRQEGIVGYTREQLNSYVGWTNDTWNSGNADNSHLTAGQIAYVQVKISDENDLSARYFVEILKVESSKVITNNLYYYTINETGYDLPCDLVCNDIVIKPETNQIVMDKTGSITCKKLVKSTNY